MNSVLIRDTMFTNTRLRIFDHINVKNRTRVWNVVAAGVWGKVRIGVKMRLRDLL